MSIHIGQLRNGNYAVLESITNSNKMRLLVECESYEEAFEQAKFITEGRQRKCNCASCRPKKIDRTHKKPGEFYLPVKYERR